MDDGIVRDDHWYHSLKRFREELQWKDTKTRDWEGPFGNPPKKKRLRHSAAEIDLPHEIDSELTSRGSHPSEWVPITRQEELRNLRAGENIILFMRARKRWEPIRELSHPPRSDETVIALRRIKPIRWGPSALSEAEKRAHHEIIRNFFFHPSPGYLNTEPTVHICSPVESAVIAIDDYNCTCQRLEDYTFQPGDTLESVTTRLLGYAEPSVVFDHSMRNLTDPQPRNRARILVGRNLIVKGSARHTERISLIWLGPTHDSRHVGVWDNGKFNDGDWKTLIPAAPGEYELIASVGQSQHKVKFKVIESETSLWARAVGMAKALANQVAKSQGAMSAEWFAGQGVFEYRDSTTGEALTPAEVAERFTTEGQEILPPQGTGEEAGAEIVKALPQTPAIVGIIGALGSEGKSILRHPQHFLDDLKKALTHSRSEMEAMGKAGMEQAHRRLDIEADSRYVDRYHGPDAMGVDRKLNNRMTETEVKGSRNDQVRVSTNNGGRKQGSAPNNLQRAKTMTKKGQQGKVGQPSNRQGGPYTEGEMELWQEVKDLGGNKQHLLVHTNTETGIVRTFMQGNAGEIGKKIDEFKMENFEDIKNAIQEEFKK